MERDFNYKSITDILHSPARQVAKICHKVKKLQALNAILYSKVPENLRAHFRAANFNNYVLILVVENSAWATRLRMLAPDLIAVLKKDVMFSDLNKIDFLLDFNFTCMAVSQNNICAPLLSEEARAIIKNSVATFTDAKLKESFLKLIKPLT